jgi:preprotein translocase subunit SecA
VDALHTELKAILPLGSSFSPQRIREIGMGAKFDHGEAAVEAVIEEAHRLYEAKEKELGEERMRTLERLVLLRVIDRLWVYHLTALEELRQGIGLQGYAQRDPLVEFKREAFDMMEQLTAHIRQNTARQIYHVTLTVQQPAQRQSAIPPTAKESGPTDEQAAAPSGAAAGNGQKGARNRVAAAGSQSDATPAGNGAPAGSVSAKTGRNDPCPCGSGKKYKKCHGAGGLASIS